MDKLNLMAIGNTFKYLSFSLGLHKLYVFVKDRSLKELIDFSSRLTLFFKQLHHLKKNYEKSLKIREEFVMKNLTQ